MLIFPLLLAVLQSPAQRRRKHHEKHGVSMPDSVNTAEEEIKPFSSDVAPAKSDTASVDTGVSQVGSSPAEETSGTTASPEETEEEAPLVIRHIPDTAVQHWKKSHDFAYANDPAYWKEADQQQEKNPGNALTRLLKSKGFLFFIYLFLGCVLLFALYKIITENNLRFFYRKPVRQRESLQGEAALPEEDLDQLLKKALDQKEHRMATRYLYLKTLRMLDAHQLIRWHIQTTDEAYARQLDGSSRGQSFRWLMGAYERVWYGKFLLDDELFSRLFQYFKDFHASLDPHSRRA
jgi:hypothetical protein